MSCYAKHDVLILEEMARGWFERSIMPRLRREANGCLVWTASLDHGYGQVVLPLRGRRQVTVKVHRVVWLRLRGEIPPNLVLDHDGPNGCSNKACCEPGHLAIATVQENSLSARQPHPSTHRRTVSGECATCQHERDAIRRDAARAVGLSKPRYGAIYGYSIKTAQAILAESQVAA